MIKPFLQTWQFINNHPLASKKRSRSWQNTIGRERDNIRLYLEDSPSLVRYLEDESLERIYRLARAEALRETGLDFPKTCADAIETVLNRPIAIDEIDKSSENVNKVYTDVRGTFVKPLDEILKNVSIDFE